MDLDFSRIKRKDRKKIFDYLISKYGIDKATKYLNSFLDKKWQHIPGEDILEILTVLDEDNSNEENEEIEEMIDDMVSNLQSVINTLKIVKKKI